MITLLLLACTGEELPPPPVTDTSSGIASVEPRYEPLPAPRLLRRMSLDLLGVLPPTADLDAVESDPDHLPALRDAMFEDPRFEDRLVQILAEWYLTRIDTFPIAHRDYGLDDALEHPYEVSVGEEPLRLMAHIAAEDLPWSETVTADYMLADDLLASVWPLDYPAGETGWQVSHWNDLRPAVGVLASNTLWWRYPSTIFNYNRTRAAAVSRLFLCDDYLARPVSFTSSPSLSDEAGTQQAVKEDPFCLACHLTMDPMAAAFFGFWWFDIYDPLELSVYHPDREPYGEVFLETTPAWYGRPIDGLAELGLSLAADPRFNRCAVETAALLLWRRHLEPHHFDTIDAIVTAFQDDGLRYKTLLAEVTDTEEYRARGALDTSEGDHGATTLRLLGPDVLMTALEDLTGFTWTAEGFEQLANDDRGYRTMAGGVDGINVSTAQRDPSVSQALVARRAAEAAAGHAVTAELIEDTSDSLLPGVTLALEPGDPGFDDALANLGWRLFAEHLGPDELADLGDLWSLVAEREDTATAWKAVLTVLLRDSRMLST